MTSSSEGPGPSGGSLAELRNAPPGSWSFPKATYRPEWINQVQEPALDPDLPIIDAQHHFHDHGETFTLEDMIATIRASGHKVVGTIYCDVQYHYRADGPEEMRPVGEIEYVRQLADAADRIAPELGVCRGIVGHADLLLGQRVQPVLEAMGEAGDGRFRGIRDALIWDPDPNLRYPPQYGMPSGVMEDSRFRDGFRRLGRMGLVFNATLFHPQLCELAALARACPETKVVIDHIGSPIAIFRFADDPKAAFAAWRAGMAACAEPPNVHVKIGGMGSPRLGLAMADRAKPPTSDDLVAAWSPYVHSCLELFGPARSMFEADYTVQRQICNYTTLWNAFKKMAASFSADEKRLVFGGVAEAVYGLASAGDGVNSDGFFRR